MKYKTVLFIILLYLCSYVLTIKQKTLGKVISNFAELNRAVGSGIEEVNALLYTLGTQMQYNFEQQEKFHNIVEGHCDQGGNLVSSYLKNLQSDLQMVNSTVFKASEDNKKAKEDLVRLDKELKESQLEINSIRTRIDRAVINYKTYGVEAEEKLVAIKSVRDIITDELLAEQPEQPEQPSFVQLRSQEFLFKVHNLKNLLHSKISHFSPMLISLLEIAEKKSFSERNILIQVLNLLKKLEQNISEFRAKQESGGKEMIERLKRSLDSAKESVKSILQIQSQTKSSYIENEQIKVNSVTEMERINDTIERKTKELEYWNNLCELQHKLKEESKSFNEMASDKIDKLIANLNT